MAPSPNGDCYGTLIQWDEGLIAAVGRVLGKQNATVEPRRFIEVFDRYEHALEQEKPHRLFQSVAAESLRLTMAELGLRHEPGDAEILTSGISKMPPFPEVVGVGGSRLPGISKCSQGAKTGEKRPFGDKHPYHQGGQP